MQFNPSEEIAFGYMVTSSGDLLRPRELVGAVIDAVLAIKTKEAQAAQTTGASAGKAGNAGAAATAGVA